MLDGYKGGAKKALENWESARGRYMCAKGLVPFTQLVKVRRGPPFMTGDGPKLVHIRPKRAKNGRLVNAPKWSKRGPK